MRFQNAPGESLMKMLILLILIPLSIFPTMVFGQDSYRWVDEKGTINFTDDPTLVPEKYRSQVQPKNPPKESSPSAVAPAAGAPQPATPQEQGEVTPKKKDMLGRDEEWWRTTVKEWNDKLAEAQKDSEAAQTALRGKTKELQDSKFKPDSLQRKLRAEMKTLEEKVKEWEKQVKEAKNTLEKALPKEVQDYGADPAWLKPKE